MNVEASEIQMQWSKDLAKREGNNRYAFFATLSSKPEPTWEKCFTETVALFSKTGPFEAKLQNTNEASYAVVFGELRAFETTLSIELEAAVSQTNEAYKRRVAQDSGHQKAAATNEMDDERIIEDLKKKFVKA